MFRAERLLVLALLGLSLSGCGAPEVEVVSLRREGIEESFTEPARTRLKQTYPLTMPAAGRVESLILRPGDVVIQGQSLGRFDTTSVDQDIKALEAKLARLQAELAKVNDNRLEETAREGAVKELAASGQALAASQAQVEAEGLRARQMEADLARDEKLLRQKAITLERLDQTRLDAHTARIDWRRQGFYTAAIQTLHTVAELGPRMVDDWLAREDHERQILEHQRQELEAELAQALHLRGQLDLRSPIDGVVLKRHHPGGATLAAGTELLTLGRMEDLEVLSEVLSRDAQRLTPGTRVTLEGRFPCQVEALEPQGFTKLSSLGVEQQRVVVRITPEKPLPGIGIGYRLEARFLTARKPNALVLPRQAVLQDRDRKAYVLQVVAGVIRRTPVSLGLTSDLEVEVTEGLEEGARVVRFPEVSMLDGASVTPRE